MASNLNFFNQLQDIVGDAILQQRSYVVLKQGTIYDDLRKALRVVMRKHPEVFWFSYQYSYDETTATLYLQYNFIPKKKVSNIFSNNTLLHSYTLVENDNWSISNNCIITCNDSIVRFKSIRNANEYCYKLPWSNTLYGFSCRRVNKKTGDFVYVDRDSMLYVFNPQVGIVITRKLEDQIKGLSVGGNEFSKVLLTYRNNDSELWAYSDDYRHFISLAIPACHDYGYTVNNTFIGDNYFIMEGGRTAFQTYRIPSLEMLYPKIDGIQLSNLVYPQQILIRWQIYYR